MEGANQVATPAPASPIQELIWIWLPDLGGVGGPDLKTGAKKITETV